MIPCTAVAFILLFVGVTTLNKTTSLISHPKGVSDVILNTYNKKTKNLYSTRDLVAKLFIIILVNACERLSGREERN